MYILAFHLSDKNGTDYIALLVGAGIGFVSGLLAFWIQHLVTKEKEKDEKARNLKHLLFLYVTEISSAQEKITQYVRQAVVGMVSKSRLTTFLGTDQIWEAARLGARTETVSALYDIYNLYQLVHHQIDKVKDASEEKAKADEFGTIYTFVHSRYPRLRECVSILIERALEANRPASKRPGRKLLVTLMAWMGRVCTEFFCGKKLVDDEDHTKSIEKCRADVMRLLDECQEWFEVMKTLSEIESGYKRLKGETGAYLRVTEEVGKSRGKKRVLGHLIRMFEVLLLDRHDDQEQFMFKSPFKSLALVGNMIASIDDREPLNSVSFVRSLVEKWKDNWKRWPTDPEPPQTSKPEAS